MSPNGRERHLLRDSNTSGIGAKRKSEARAQNVTDDPSDNLKRSRLSGLLSTGPTLVRPPQVSKFVITSGREMRETSLAFTSIAFAPMRFAMKRWRSGSMVRSSVETAYQLGFERHAAWVVLPASSVRLNDART